MGGNLRVVALLVLGHCFCALIHYIAAVSYVYIYSNYIKYNNFNEY